MISFQIQHKMVKRVKNNIAKTIISKINLEYNVSLTHKIKSHW